MLIAPRSAERRFRYDNLYQLTRAEYPDITETGLSVPIDNSIWQWDYDDIGNRI